MTTSSIRPPTRSGDRATVRFPVQRDPADPPGFRPAHVLGCTEAEAAALLSGRRVTPGEVEALATVHYDWRRHTRDRHSYWVTAPQAAAVLRVPTAVVQRMLAEDRLPHVVHVSGVRLMRRHEIEERARLRFTPSR